MKYGASSGMWRTCLAQCSFPSRLSSPHAHLPALAVPPGDPALPVPAVVDAVGAGELLARGAGVPALGAHQGDEEQLVQVDLQELHVFRLQQTSWAPGSIPLFPL